MVEPVLYFEEALLSLGAGLLGLAAGALARFARRGGFIALPPDVCQQ
jgi:hypothetical protein